MISNELLIGIVTAAITASVTLISSYLAHKMAIKKMLLQLRVEYDYQEQKDLKNKLEELYFLVEKWASSFGSYHIPLMSVMRGELTYNDALDLVIKYEKENKYDFKKIELLLNLYFDDLKDKYSSIIEKRATINKIIFAHKERYKQGDIDGELFLKPFTEAQLSFHKSIELFKEEIVIYSKSIMRKNVV